MSDVDVSGPYVCENLYATPLKLHARSPSMLISAPSGEGMPPSSSSALIFGRQRSVTATLTYCVSSRARSDELLELFWRRMPGGILYYAFSSARAPRRRRTRRQGHTRRVRRAD